MYLDPGGDATKTVGHFNTDVGSTGLVTYDPTVQVVGVGSYKFDSDDGSQPVCASVNGVMGESRRVSAYFIYDSVPDAVRTTTKFAEDIIEHYSGGGFSILDGDLAADDAAYTTATPAKNAGQGTVYGTFGLTFGAGTIPVGAAIDSVKFIYEYKVDTADSEAISRVKWRINGEEGPDHDDTSEPLTDTVVEVDVTADREWTRDVLTDAAFEVIAEARRGDTDTGHTQSYDYLKVQVQWHLDGIVSVRNSVDADGFQIGAAPRGGGVVLRLIDNLGTFYFGITELLPNVQNRIGFAYLQTGADADVAVFINGIPELTATLAVGGSPMANLRYGWVDSPGVDHLCWFDQLAIDIGDDIQDIGNVLMTAKLSAAVNEDNWNTTGGTGAINERPLSATNYRQHTVAEAVRQTYTLEAADEGDVDVSGESLIGYMGWVWSRMGFGEVDSLKLVVNNIEIDKTAEYFNNSNGTSQVMYRSATASQSYPSHAAGIGMVSNEGTADTFLYEGGVVQAYQGPPSPNVLLSRQLVNNESLATIVDDLRADPPDSYEVCCNFPEFDGSVEIIVHSLDQDGGSVSYQGTLNSNGRMRITPGVEVYLDVTVTGVTNLQVWRRLNVD